MILDVGIARIYKRPATGGIREPSTADLGDPVYESWYGERTVGMTRYWAASQAEARIDTMIRIIAPEDRAVFGADDIVIAAGKRWRILQVQWIDDTDSGCAVGDISLERMGERYEPQ